MFDNSKVCVKKFERSFAKLRERKFDANISFAFPLVFAEHAESFFPAVAAANMKGNYN